MKALSQRTSDGETKPIRFRCSGCRRACEALIMPWSPQVSKYKCRDCGTVSEIKTRDSFEEQIADHVAEGKDRNDFNRRNPVTIILTDA